MNTKLTLKLDKSTIDKAKKYARDRNISLSKMIENYLQAMTNEQSIEFEVSPLVESLIGVIKPPAREIDKEYSEYLSEKYK